MIPENEAFDEVWKTQVGQVAATDEKEEKVPNYRPSSRKDRTMVFDLDLIDKLAGELKSTEFLVYLYLYRQTIGEGRERAEIRYDEMTETLGMTKNTMIRVVKSLKNMRLIKYDVGYKGKGNVYSLIGYSRF